MTEQSQYFKIGLAIAVLILLAAYLPQIVQTGEGIKNMTKPAPAAAGNASTVITVEKPVYVAGSINLTANTRTFNDVQMWRMVAKRTAKGTTVTTKGTGRAATQEEWTNFLKYFENNKISTKAIKGTTAISDVFWNQTNVWAGYFVTNKDRTFLLVLINVGKDPEFAKLDVLSSDPETNWSIWKKETEDDKDSAIGAAAQVFLGAGGL
jgi:hypothetical protein